MKQRGKARALAFRQGESRARCPRLVQRQPEERADAHQVHGETRLRQHRSQQPLELGAARLQALPSRLALEQRERRQSRRHRHGVAREGAGLVSVAIRGEPRHDAARAAERPDRHAPADHLAEGRQIRGDAKELCRAAARQAEPGDHFIENEQRAVLARELAQAGEEFAPLRQQAVIGRQRLDDEGRDARALALKQLLQRRLVIERQHARAGRERFRHARGGWAAEGGESRARRDQQVIRMTVVAAGEFDDEVPAGESARHADGAHDRLGSRGHEAHLLGGRVAGHHLLGELDFRGARRPVGHAARERLGHGREHRRVRMPGDQGTPGADQVEVSAAIGVEHLRARAARDEQRRPAHRAEGAHR